MVRAVLEGVAFSQRQGIDLMRASGATATTARGAGGGFSSPIWRQFLADVLNIGIQTTSAGIGAARGAAILAGMGTNLYTNPDRGIDWSTESVTSPDPCKHTALDRAYQDYVDLYPRLKGAFATHR